MFHGSGQPGCPQETFQGGLVMTTTSEAESKRFNRLSCLIIILAGLIVYSNTIHSSFHFDDSAFVDDPLARDLHNIPRFFQENDISLPSRGLATTSLAVNYYFSGLSVEGYHWTNISIHLMNGVLVYFLMLIILGEYVSGGGAAGLTEILTGRASSPCLWPCCSSQAPFRRTP